ncbi:hypothetical protein TNCV_1210881 [Trichonephila clavipes]|nr:hypothetical protein TNCV_1210881 [Trichonephila clavipes]
MTGYRTVRRGLLLDEGDWKLGQSMSHSLYRRQTLIQRVLHLDYQPFDLPTGPDCAPLALSRLETVITCIRSPGTATDQHWHTYCFWQEVTGVIEFFRFFLQIFTNLEYPS